MKWEIHSHSIEGSPCSRMYAEQLVEAHAAAGYAGVVLTDHFNYDALMRHGRSPIDQVSRWLQGYENARAAGERTGLKVLFGLEARLPVNENDYLIIGAEPEFVLENPTLHENDLPGLFALCEKYNALLIQAHPFRRPCIPADPKYLHGMEISNNNPRAMNNNDLTVEFMQAHPRLIATSGSDYHRTEDLGLGSITLLRSVNTSAEMAQCLRDRAFEIILRQKPM